MSAAGTPAILQSTPSSAVRVCLAARQEAIDLEGAVFRLGGEAYTQSKAAVVADAGARAFCHYFMAEAGLLGIACAVPAEPGDVHVALDKVALLRRPRRLATGETVDALLLTTLLPVAPKLMLNVETDDYAVLERRDCGCLVGAAGFGWHLRGIRSYEKLTSEGMSFLGDDLVTLVEHVLPGRFSGGRPTISSSRKRRAASRSCGCSSARGSARWTSAPSSRR